MLCKYWTKERTIGSYSTGQLKSTNKSSTMSDIIINSMKYLSLEDDLNNSYDTDEIEQEY